MGGVGISTGDGKRAFQDFRLSSYSETMDRLYSAEKAERKADYGRPQIHEKLLDHREFLEVFKQSSDIIRIVL